MKKKALALCLVFLMIAVSSPVFAQNKPKNLIVGLNENLQDRFADMMEFIVSVDRQGIQKWLADSRKDKPHFKDDMAAESVIGNAADKAGVLGALSAVAPGVFSIPASIGEAFATWVIYARLTYTIACVYGPPPSHDEFRDDFYLLLGGEDAVRDTLRENGVNITQSLLADMGTKAAKRHFTPARKKMLLNTLAGKILAKAVKVGAAVKVVKELPGLASIIGYAQKSISASAFGYRAVKYYRNHTKARDVRGLYESDSVSYRLIFLTSGGSKGTVEVIGYTQRLSGTMQWSGPGSSPLFGTGKFVVRGNTLEVTFGKLSVPAAFANNRYYDNAAKNIGEISGKKRVYSIAAFPGNSAANFTFVEKGKTSEGWEYENSWDRQQNYRLFTTERHRNGYPYLTQLGR